VDGGLNMARYSSPLLSELLRTLLRKRITIRYPFAPVELPKGYRGLVVADPAKCRGCGLCVRDCPADALELEKGDDGSFRLILHPERCAYCGQCEISCHFGSIQLTSAFKPGATSKEELITVLVDHPADEDSHEDD